MHLSNTQAGLIYHPLEPLLCVLDPNFNFTNSVLEPVQECHAMGRKGSWRAVARKYGISWAVLYPRLRGKIAVNASLGAKAMLSREMEEQIYHHCLAMADQVGMRQVILQMGSRGSRILTASPHSRGIVK